MEFPLRFKVINFVWGFFFNEKAILHGVKGIKQHDNEKQTKRDVGVVKTTFEGVFSTLAYYVITE